MSNGYKVNMVKEGTTIYRAAPFLSIQTGNGKATSTQNNFSWFASSLEGAEPYVNKIHPWLNKTTKSRIFEFEVVKPLLLIDLSHAPTIKKLDENMTKAKLGNMSKSFIIGKNGEVKRVSGVNQFSKNKLTANRLRSFLLTHHPHISGWRHGKMERPGGGGFQKEELLMFTPRHFVEAQAARGSLVPSPLRLSNLNSRKPLAPVSSPHQGGSSSSRQAGPSPRRAKSPIPAPRHSKGKRRRIGLFSEDSKGSP